MKIPSKKIKRQYELTFLTPTAFTDSEASKIIEEVEALVKKHKGKVEKKENWNKKKLAYKIKHAGKSYDEALYTHLVVEFESTKIPVFEKDLKLNQKIIRYLLIVID